MPRFLHPLALCLFLTACYSMAIQPIPTKPAPELPEGYRAAPVRFGRTFASIPRGTEVGGYVMSLTCAGPFGRVTWRKGPGFLGDSDLVETFNSALSDAGYEVAGDPEHVADLENTEEELMRAEYVISARIRSVKVNLCRETDMFMRQLGVSGEAVMEVEWSIYSSVQRRQMKRITTKGYWKAIEATDDGLERALSEAFGAAASNLAAQPDFQNLIMEQPEADPPSAPPAFGNAVTFKPAAAINAPHSPAAAVASTTVVSTSTGHGSGFFIAPDLVLTNTHVVGEAERVRIKPVYGHAVAGRVLRREPQRDVALIRVEKIPKPAPAPLAIRLQPLKLGEEVFAIGAPIREGLTGTLTRGIVSSFRKDKTTQLEIIQADVIIHPGNSGGPLIDHQGQVVGISQAIFADHGQAAEGLSIFIPIQSALQRLGLEANPINNINKELPSLDSSPNDAEEN